MRVALRLLASLLLCWLLGASAPAAAQAPPLKARAMLREARELAGKKQLAAAADKVESALRLAPQDAELWRLAGACYELMNDRPKAHERYRRYLALCPACPEAEAVRALLAEREASGAGDAGPARLGPRERATSRSARAEARAGEILDLADELQAEPPGSAGDPQVRLVTALAFVALRLAPEGSPHRGRAEGLLTGLHGTLKAARAQAAKARDLARRTYEIAYVIKESAPDRAFRLCRAVQALTPPGSAYHEKAAKLLTRLAGR